MSNDEKAEIDAKLDALDDVEASTNASKEERLEIARMIGAIE